MAADLASADLEDAREALSYWERRERLLPRHRLRARREARLLARRWQTRVAAAERDHYGRGLVGALLLVISERRVPEALRGRGRRLARRTARVATAVGVVLTVLTAMTTVAVAQLIGALLAQ
jgi:hypothetical protein